MSRPVTIVLALGAERESAQPIGRPDGVKAVFASGQQLVHVTLMAHVPHKFVLRRGKDKVQRDGQFDHAEIRPQMASILGQFDNQVVADFPGQLAQLIQGQFFDV